MIKEQNKLRKQIIKMNRYSNNNKSMDVFPCLYHVPRLHLPGAIKQ